jgi:hypothetical protein
VPRISSSKGVAVLAAVAFLVVISGPRSATQVRYASNQNVVPVFEGWERNPDGSFNMVFGYMNRNYEEELDVPVGPDNQLEPGVPDQGQPTHFYARRQQFVFKVTVPKDWGKKDLIWTLNVHGKTEKAFATLLPFWELGSFVYQENRGGPGDITDKPEPNEAPTIRISGSTRLSASVGESIQIAAQVSDDGHPIRRSSVRRDSDGAVITGTGTQGPGATGVRRENPLTQAVVRLDPGVGLGVSWVVYRGSADAVTFQPRRLAVKDGSATTHITFTRPGTYTLRAYADDGVLVTPADVVVTVRPGSH